MQMVRRFAALSSIGRARASGFGIGDVVGSVRKWVPGRLLCALLAINPFAPAAAALIIDGEGGTPAPGGRPLNHNLETSFYSQALRFTLTEDTTITGIQAMLAGTRSGAYTISLADASNLDTDNNIYSIDLYADLVLTPCAGCFVPTDFGRYIGPMNLNWFVVAGDYWLKFTVPFVGNFAGFDGFLRSAGHYEYMAGADIADPGGYRDFGPDYIAVSIYGDRARYVPVPEPTSMGLMVLGLVALGLHGHRRRKL
jgi:hypothetical protein